MATDELVAQGARASAAMISIFLFKIIRASSPERLTIRLNARVTAKSRKNPDQQNILPTNNVASFPITEIYYFDKYVTWQ